MENEAHIGTKPSTPPSYSRFVSIWSDSFSNLRIAGVGSEFCDTCASIRNAFSCNSDEIALQNKQSALAKHKSDARSEREYMRKYQIEAKNSAGTVLHVIIDFAEKVLLPSLLEQPDQLHFVSGLEKTYSV